MVKLEKTAFSAAALGSDKRAACLITRPDGAPYGGWDVARWRRCSSSCVAWSGDGSRLGLFQVFQEQRQRPIEDHRRIAVRHAVPQEILHTPQLLDRIAANRIVELAKAEFSQARLLVRSYDREHSLELINAGVDFQIRETFESAVEFGAAALIELGVAQEEAERIATEIRRRDAERFELEMAAGDVRAGAPLMLGNVPKPKPTPFTTPKREGQALNEETADVIKSPDLDSRTG